MLRQTSSHEPRRLRRFATDGTPVVALRRPYAPLIRSFGLSLGLALGLLTAASCVPKPKQDYRPDQIGQIDSLEEIMRVQSFAMDPLFAKQKQPAFTETEYAAMADAARKLQSSAAAVHDRFAQTRRPSFATYSEQLGAEATKLLKAAEAKEADQASAALGAMQETCRTCHKEYR